MAALMERRVLESFMKRDTGGEGTIRRGELALVLRHLDKSFTDAAIEKLLDLLDTNQDGNIKLEEFLQWMFQSEGLKTKGDLRMQLRDLEHVASSAVAEPPNSLEDDALSRYAFKKEDEQGWYVEVVSFDALSGQACLVNGLRIPVPAGEASKLEQLLATVPQGAVVSGLLQRHSLHAADERRLQEREVRQVLVDDFEHVAPEAVANPPKSLADPAVLRYLSEKDMEGWYVAIKSFEAPTQKALLSNGVQVKVPVGQTEELARLLATVPDGAVVSGRLFVDSSSGTNSVVAGGYAQSTAGVPAMVTTCGYA
eukprot:TRINITY_DN96491_c0_g1_i1.p1 TRINITY_DN96491_c0_g1~~TRINITY_DN96491_c0_g1_i1.p1  ORF type:complete len:330 (-),score=58.22 TRINITY_DN96491_c0_g1_i1:97-1029(-)